MHFELIHVMLHVGELDVRQEVLERLSADPTKPLDTSDRLVDLFVDALVEAANVQKNSREVRDGPTTTTTIFEFISRGPTFHFWGSPRMTHQMPFYTVEHRETTKIFHLMCHQMPFWCGIRCKTFLEDYGCGCDWAVPEEDRFVYGFAIDFAKRFATNSWS